MSVVAKVVCVRCKAQGSGRHKHTFTSHGTSQAYLYLSVSPPQHISLAETTKRDEPPEWTNLNILSLTSSLSILVTLSHNWRHQSGCRNFTETPERPKLWHPIGSLAVCVAKQRTLFHLLCTAARSGPHTWFWEKSEWNGEVKWWGEGEESPTGTEAWRLERGGHPDSCIQLSVYKDKFNTCSKWRAIKWTYHFSA